MSGLYIHIPFCTKKCIYCDFFSVGSRNIDWATFVNSLISELRYRKCELTNSVNTIYIGGGTPSLMPINCLKSLIEAINSELGVILNIEEFTIEVNPDDVNDEYVIALKDLGINRISMGIQSFNDNELQIIKRRHSSEQSLKAFKSLTHIGNVSLDLIFGLPNQTLKSWEYNLDKILDLRPHHISAYSLMYEEGTALYKMREQGRIKETDDELSLKMFQALITRLKAAGYNQYEISNFALDGYESRHNSSYWDGVQYLGLGPSAHSYDGNNIRRENPASVKQYIANYSTNSGNKSLFYKEEILNQKDLYNEYVITRMRKIHGIEINDLKNKFNRILTEHFLSQAKKHILSGRLIDYGNRIGLTDKGVLISDSIFIDLMY